jgi:hypothetical protein
MHVALKTQLTWLAVAALLSVGSTAHVACSKPCSTSCVSKGFYKYKCKLLKTLNTNSSALIDMKVWIPPFTVVVVFWTIKQSAVMYYHWFCSALRLGKRLSVTYPERHQREKNFCLSLVYSYSFSLMPSSWPTDLNIDQAYCTILSKRN